jgi:protein NRD1
MGMENFDPATFNFTSPADWEALGKMWQVTNGYLPSTEELMQFVMTSTISQAMPDPNMSSQDFQPNSFTSGAGRGRGGGRGGFPGGRQAYGNGRGMHSEGGSVYGYANQTQNTDAIVLGEGTPLNRDISHPSSNGKEQWDQSSNQGPIDANSTSAGGRMQRIGDKWVFVRATAATTMDVGS